MSLIRREALNALLIVTGILSAGMGLKGFLVSSHFIDGGLTGISMLLSKVTPISLSLWLPVVYLPFVMLGDRRVGCLGEACRSVCWAAVIAAGHSRGPAGWRSSGWRWRSRRCIFPA